MKKLLVIIPLIVSILFTSCTNQITLTNENIADYVEVSCTFSDVNVADTSSIGIEGFIGAATCQIKVKGKAKGTFEDATIKAIIPLHNNWYLNERDPVYAESQKEFQRFLERGYFSWIDPALDRTFIAPCIVFTLQLPADGAEYSETYSLEHITRNTAQSHEPVADPFIPITVSGTFTPNK